MSTDILYPVLIGAGCLVVIVVVHLLTRPKPSKADIRLPGALTGSEGDGGASPSDLGDWHRTHEASVLGFIDVCDREGGFDPDNAEDAQALVALDVAVEEHPAPEMRAELAALRASAHAIAGARERKDGAATDTNVALYESYRDAWLERLRQFPVDSDRIEAALERGRAEG